MRVQLMGKLFGDRPHSVPDLWIDLKAKAACVREPNDCRFKRPVATDAWGCPCGWIGKEIRRSTCAQSVANVIRPQSVSRFSQSAGSPLRGSWHSCTAPKEESLNILPPKILGLAFSFL
jgi:hypothetical protein